MKIRTSEDFRNSLKKLHTRLYARAERITDVTSHPLTAPHWNCAAMTYEVAADPAHEDTLTARSHLTGKRISRFTHIHQSTDDLVRKVRMIRLLGQKTAACFQRCVGFDGINAVYSVTYEIDEKYGTSYHARFTEYLKRVQEDNLMLVGAMTDAKGDRGARPSEQADRDAYTHIVEKKPDGIVISGAKLHQTGAANSHEILIMPTTALREAEKDFAVSCAVPIDAPGVTLIFGRQMNDTRRLEGCGIDLGNERFAVVGGECLIVFDKVFVPTDRIFMCGETEFAGLLVDRFASAHRCNYGACKVGLADVLIGATALLAEYHNVEKSSHVRDKITEMIHLNETLHASSLAAALQGTKTRSGAYIVDPLYANVTKQNVTRFLYEIARLAHDVAGGFVATMPSEKDLRSRDVGGYIEKYFTARSGVPVEHRMRVGRLIENLTGPTSLIEAMQGAGSPQAQRLIIFRQGDLDGKKKLAKDLAGIR